MRLSTEQLAQHLSRDLAPLYTVFGGEPLLATEASDRIRAQARARGYTEREVLTAEQHFDWSQLTLSSNSQSLFASRRILELRIPGGKPGTDGGQALQELCERLPADTVTLVCLPEADWKAQKASWFAALEAAGVMVEARPVVRSALPAWLAGRLKAQGHHADGATLDFISDRVEGNLLAAYQEVQKLALLFPAGKLEFGQVEEAVLDVARYDVFDLGRIVLAGDPSHFARVLEGLRGEGTAPPLALWAISEQVRALGKLLAALAAGVALPQAMREARIWGPALQGVIQRNHKHFSVRQVEGALLHASRIDRVIKGLEPGDAWDELLRLGLRFARGTAPGARKTG